MRKAQPPKTEGAPISPEEVHIHGPTEGVLERFAVWSLGDARQGGGETAAARAIRAAFQGMNGHAPELRFGEGDITAQFGRIEHGAALSLAVMGLHALRHAEVQEVPVEERGVGVSVKIVAFPE